MAELNTYFTRGMIQDSLESLQPEGSYRFAFNAVTQSKDRSNFGLTNEEEIEQVASLGGTIVGKSYIEERNKTLLFVQNGGSQLWLFDHKTNQIQFVCSDTEFSCDWGFSNCEFIYGEFKKFNKCKELHVYWSSECTYHVVNIDEMLNPTRKAAVKTLDDVCGHFDLFKPVCGPHISAIPSKFNGSTLEAGSYACAIQLSDTDGNTSNVFDIGQFAVAESEDNIGGQTSKSSIKFHISSLDKRYNKAIIYIIKTVKGVTVIEKMDSLSYSDKGITYEYYGQKGEIVHVSNLITRNKAYLRGQDLLQKDGFLFFYSLRNEKNLNYQKYANQISCEYVEWESSFEQCSKYFYVSLLRGETYAIGIVWKFADGTFTNVYHIPGGVAGASILENRVSTAASSSGAQFDIGALVTTNQFTRHRNPSELKDRANESDKLEDSTNTDVDNIDTNRDNIVDSGTCHDNLYECTTANTVLDQDIDDVSNTMESNAELLAGMGIDDPDPDVNTTSNLKESALKLIEDAVTNREYVRRQRPKFSLEADPSSVSIDNVEAAVLAEDRGDNWVDGDGKSLTDEVPVELSSGPMEVYTSNIDYPKDKDCDGNFFYPQGKIKHHKVPWTSQLPHFVSDTFGVENQYQPDNHPYSKTRIRTIGLRLSNIHRPTEDELPKPLCPNSPFKIVYVKRTDENKSIFAKGWLNGIFTGKCNGTTYAFPRHGVNSFEHVDRMISTGVGGLSRLGVQSDDPVYNFHSPDTDSDKSGIPVNKIKPELQLKGNGWKYGLYAEGKKPVNQWEGTRDDAFGCRIGNNLSQYTTVSGASGNLINLVGITEAPANTSPTKVASMTYPLMNRFRESSIYLQAASRLPGDERDQSFIGGVVDHFAPTKCNAPYAALVRDIPDQYGSIEGLRYADLGINATTKHANGLTTISGICGDTYVGPYSKKRTSYISNKKGDLFNVPAKPDSPCRQRSWCDSPEDKIFEYLGIDYYPTKIPKSGDIYDPKNYAGLHTVNGDACGRAVTKRDAQAPMTSESDWYGPKTLSGVVHTIVECEVNPYLRESGEGSQLVEGKVHYRNLKDLHLDAAAPVGQPHEGSWLGRFHSFVQQPSVKQLTKKAAIRTALTLGGPAGALINLSSLEGVIGPAFAMMGWSMLSALWILATNTLFTDKRLNEMLRIGECKRDEEGGDLDAESIRGFEDNYTVYNRDHTRINDIYPYTAFPLPFNTCDCSECLVWNTDVTMADLSRRQIKDIKVGDEVISFDFSTQEYVNKKVTTVWDRGEQEVYRIYLRPGTNYVDATLNHKWFAVNRWSDNRVEIITTKDLIEAQDFQSNSRRAKYCLIYANNIPTVEEDFLTEEEGYLLGMYIAEGNHNHFNKPHWKHKFKISQFKTETKNKIREALEKTNFKWSENVRGFYLMDLDGLEELFNDCGRGAENKKIPDEIFRLKKSTLQSIYNGLIDGDGSRSKAHIDGHGYDIAEREVFYTASKQLEYDVRYLSNLIGRPHSPSGASNRSGFGSKKPQYITGYSEKGYLNRGRAFIRKIEKLENKVSTFDIEIEDTKNFILSDTGVISHNCDKSNINNDIYYSNKQNPDSDIDAYKNVKINNYQNTPCHYGDLKRMIIVDNQVFTHLTDGLALVKLNPIQMQSDIVLQQSGDGQMLTEPQIMYEGVAEGFAGTEHPNAGILTPYGYFFVDNRASKLYRFSGSPEEISSYGMYNFFKNSMPFCNEKECYDEKAAEGNHYSLGWDPRLNRLLITKYDGDKCNSWTISFEPRGEQSRYVSFHSYVPQDYFWDRENIYSYAGGKIYKHHKSGSYGKCYGENVSFIVETSVPGGQAFKFKTFELDTRAEKGFVKDLDKTFNKIAVYNSTQGTGTRDVIALSDNPGKINNQYSRSEEDPSKIVLHKVRRRWKSNDVFDLVKDGCSEESLLTKECECTPLESINEEVFDCNVMKTQDYRGREMEDDHIMFRFVYDEANDTRLYLKRLKIETY